MKLIIEISLDSDMSATETCKILSLLIDQIQQAGEIRIDDAWVLRDTRKRTVGQAAVKGQYDDNDE